MPKIMEKQDWIQTVANIGLADRVWSENISTNDGRFPMPTLEAGTYQVIFVRVESNPKVEVAKRPSAVELIGYGRKFNPKYRSTAEIMKELREGEDA